MGGVFLLKMFKRVFLCAVIVSCAYLLSFLFQWQRHSDSLIRFHVIAASDSPRDQAVKLQVRDAVLMDIQQDLQNISDISEARKYLQAQLPRIEKIVRSTLAELGYPETSRVELCRQAFDTRHYETFSLPAGIYDSLRIIIGQGQGKNWWCVAFPTLCIPAATEGFREVAAGAGFSQTLIRTLSDDGQFQIRFYLLDQVGKLENYFFRE